MFVQFEDSELKKIQSVFSCHQDDAIYPNQGEVDETDDRYKSFIESLSPTQYEVNSTIRDTLLSNAALRIAPLQDAVDLDKATAQETVLLKSWKQYRIDLNRIDLTVTKVSWPEQPSG